MIKVIVGNNGLGWTLDKKIADVLYVSLYGASFVSFISATLLYLDEAQRFELILSRVDPPIM